VSTPSSEGLKKFSPRVVPLMWQSVRSTSNHGSPVAATNAASASVHTHTAIASTCAWNDLNVRLRYIWRSAGTLWPAP